MRWVIGLAVVGFARTAAAAPRETVILDDGSKVEGTLVEYVAHDHVTLELDGGEVRRIAWSHVRSVNEVAANAAVSAASGVVILKDGTLVRGELVETVAGDHVSIRLADGEVRRIEWSLVAGVATGAAPTTTSTSAATANIERLESLLLDGGAHASTTEVLTDWPEPDRSAADIPAVRVSVGLESMINGPMGHAALAAEVARQWGILGVGFHAAYGPNGEVGQTLSGMLTVEWSYGGRFQQGLGFGLAQGFRSVSAMPGSCCTRTSASPRRSARRARTRTRAPMPAGCARSASTGWAS